MELDLVDFNTIEFSKIFSEDNQEVSIDESDIAIIGASCKFGSLDNMSELWDSLINGECIVNELSNRRKSDIESFLKQQGMENQNVHYVKGAYLKAVDLFDNEFFHVSPTEARFMDPNQRLFLETAWHALEDAGYANEEISNSKLGIYVGYSDDFSFHYKDFQGNKKDSRDGIGFTGNLRQMIASRLAYFLNTKGPCMMIDTGCSSSLTAIHTACRAIQNGECKMAIAGGIKLNLLPIWDVMDRGVDISSKDGKTKTFDYESDGTGFGEGVGVILLKSCRQAYEDNDQIYAVIKGSALNQDGHSVGITAPNMESQEEVIKETWKNAKVKGEDIRYIEAHGTGTQLGDTIEVGAIENVYKEITNRKQFVGIGSIKSNLGHLDGAAGMAGIMKCILSLKNRMVPPTINFTRPNNKIRFLESPVYVTTSPISLTNKEKKNLIALSSFGIGGSNCHIVLDFMEEKKTDKNNNERNIFVLSAQTKASLISIIKQFTTFLREDESNRIEDICSTLCNGRLHMKNRLCIVFRNREELIQKLLYVCETSYQCTEISEDGIYYQEGCSMVDEPKSFFSPSILNDNDIDLGNLVGQKYILGYEINWKSLYPPEKYKKVSLPLYQYNRKRFWYEYDLRDNVSSNNSVNVVIQKAQPEKYTKEAFMEEIRESWKLVFGYKEIQDTANFFEIGGDSIIASKIINYISQILMLQISMKDLLSNPVFMSFVSHTYALYEQFHASSADKVEHIQTNERFELSEAQMRIYLLCKGNLSDLSMNIPNMLRIKSDLDIDKFENAFLQLIQRHESLRTSFYVTKGEVHQKVNAHVDFSLERYDAKENMVPSIIKNFIRPFSMEDNSLFRAGIIKLDSKDFILMLDFHHIIVDGTSINILTQELFALYQEKKLLDPNYSYNDYVAWNKNFIKTNEFKEMEEYWISQFDDFKEQKHIPYDYCSEEGTQHIGEIYSFVLGETETKSLLEIRDRKNITLYAIIMSAFGVCLSRYLGSDDIVIGSPVMGRNRKEFEKMVGLFINILPIRIKVNKESSCQNYLESVKKTILQGLIYQEYPYTRLVQNLKSLNSLHSDNMFHITFIMQNTMLDETEYNGQLAIEPYAFRDEGIVGDLILETRYTGNKIGFIMKYCKELYARETIESIANTLKDILIRLSLQEKQLVSELITNNDEKMNEELMNFNEQLEE